MKLQTMAEGDRGLHREGDNRKRKALVKDRKKRNEENVQSSKTPSLSLGTLLGVTKQPQLLTFVHYVV